jgi:hypothetical protein
LIRLLGCVECSTNYDPCPLFSPDGFICIPSPTLHSFDIIDFISIEFPERVGEEDDCYLQNEMVKVKIF